MARLLGPDANSRLVYSVVGPRLASQVAATATVYADAAGTVLADIRTYDGTQTPGAAIAGATLTVDANSLLPFFWFPDSIDKVYVKVGLGPVTAVNADYDARLDAIVGVNYRGAWAVTTVYAVNDFVTLGGELLICKTAHTSGTAFSLTNWSKLTGATGVYNVMHYGAKGDGVTDDTAAINAAVSAAYNGGVADGSYYAEVYFPPAIYLVNGPLTKGGATKGDAIIPLPVLPVAGQKFTLVFRGARDVTGLWHWQQTTSQKAGSVLKTTLAGTQDATYGEASVLGGPTPQQGYGRTNSLFSNMLIVIDGIEILVPNNPAICGFDLRGLAEANVPNAACMADATPSTVVQATNAWQFGLAMPMNNNNAKSTIGSYSAEGLNYGLFADEHTVANSIQCIYCVAAIEVGQGGDTSHGMVLNYVCAEACNVAIGAATASFAAKVECKLLDYEGGALGGTFALINDPSNVLFGTINATGIGVATHVTSGTGGFTVRNGSNLRVYDLTRQQGYGGAVTVPASAAALLNPFYRDAAVTITGGTVTAITVDGVATGLTSGTVILPTNRNIAITYTVAPTWVWTLL